MNAEEETQITAISYVTHARSQATKKYQCPLNKTTHKTAAMVQMNNDDYRENHSTRPHECDEAQAEGQVKLACGCMLPVVAGALSLNGENKLKQWKLKMTPCSEGEVNGIRTMVLRDTGQLLVWLRLH